MKMADRVPSGFTKQLALFLQVFFKPLETRRATLVNLEFDDERRILRGKTV